MLLNLFVLGGWGEDDEMAGALLLDMLPNFFNLFDWSNLVLTIALLCLSCLKFAIDKP